MLLSYIVEFIFYGYSNYAPGVILMTGFPDLPETQPQHDKYRDPFLAVSGLRNSLSSASIEKKSKPRG